MEPKKTAVALSFAIGDDLRFLSHRETMRLWQRALVRTGAPLSYSGGFNPHLRLTLPMPRGVGVAAEDELLVFEITQTMSLDDLWDKLHRQTPEGLRLGEIGYLPPQWRLVAQEADYRLRVSDQVEVSALAQRIEEFRQAESRMIQRQAHGHHPQRQINLKIFITQVELHGQDMKVTLRVTEEGSCRLEELMNAFDIHHVGHVADITRLTTRYHLKTGPGADEEVIQGQELFSRLGTLPRPSAVHTQYNERG